MLKPEVLIDFSKLHSNIALLQEAAVQQVLFPVLKADAYGHDSVLIATELEATYPQEVMPYFCVARLGEAVELRKAGVQRNVLVLSQFSCAEFSEDLKNITLVINDTKDLEEVLAIKAKVGGNLAGVHLHFNTGMNRLGMKTSDVPKVSVMIQELRNQRISIDGLMTHLACADEAREKFTLKQYHAFVQWVETMKPLWDRGSMPRWIHMSNSSGIMALKDIDHGGVLNAARPGILLWGTFQSLEEKSLQDPDNKFQPVLSVRAPVRQVFVINEGEQIGYGLNFEAPRKTVVGTVCLGYADGLLRRLNNNSSKLYFKIEGFPVPFIGNISMDLASVDLTDHPRVKEFISTPQTQLVATWMAGENDIYQAAEILEMIPYEVYCSLGYRLNRRPLSE